MTEVHPIWGRPIGQYAGSFTFEVLMQELYSKMFIAMQNENVTIMNAGMDSIHSILNIGKETDGRKIKYMASRITLQKLRDTLGMAWYKGMIGFLTEPEVVQGCIKLMATVIPDGHETASPFSYEYGYICFRIAVISLSLCLTEPLLDAAYKAVLEDLRSAKVHVLQVVSEVVANSVRLNVQVSPTLRIQNDRVKYEGSLVIPPHDLFDLMDMLWLDRDIFLRAILQTYTPGMTGVMYLFWQLWRKGRQASNQNEADRLLGVPVYELLRRYHLGVTHDQDLALSALLSDTKFLEDLWLNHSQLLDAKDSKTLIHGYIRRITNPATWYYRPNIHSLPPILEFVARFAQLGSENVFSSLFSSTVCFLWTEFEAEHQIKGDYIDSIVRIFHFLIKLIEVMPDTAHYAMQTLVRELVGSDLVGLIAKLIVSRRLAIEKSDNERVKNHQLLTKIEKFFERLRTKFPQKLLAGFSENLDDWLRYRDHMRWCSEILGPSEQNHRYYDAGGEVWKEISGTLDQGANDLIAISWSTQCSYKRCSHSGLMPGMQFTCSGCGVAYCSRRCQTMDRIYAHEGVEHWKHCKSNSLLFW